MNRTNCAFCPKPDKVTRWFHEDAVCLLINKPTGEPMLVLREHTTEASEKQMAHMERVAERYCGNHELQKIMNHVPNHLHFHIVNYDHHPEDA